MVCKTRKWRLNEKRTKRDGIAYCSGEDGQRVFSEHIIEERAFEDCLKHKSM